MAKNTCSNCGDAFIGRAGSSYCKPACKQRAHRARKGDNRNAGGAESVTVTPPRVRKRRPRRQQSSKPAAVTQQVSVAGRSAEAQALLDSIAEELAENSDGQIIGDGQWFGLSTADEKSLQMAADAVDRKVDLTQRWLDCDDDGLRVRMMGELRLLEQAIAKLLKTIDTAPPPVVESHTTVRARNAANRRWDTERARGAGQG